MRVSNIDDRKADWQKHPLNSKVAWFRWQMGR
jgi:hypothetical protein